MDELRCPFCGFEAGSDYRLMYHVESLHAGGQSPFMVVDGHGQQDPLSRIVEDRADFDDDIEFVGCPRESCGEVILMAEIETHISMHEIENGVEDKTPEEHPPQTKVGTGDIGSAPYFDTSLPPALRNIGTSSMSAQLSVDRRANAKARWREILNMTGSRHEPRVSEGRNRSQKRLGKSELGPHANEKQMPAWLRQLLEDDGKAKAISDPSRIGKISRVKIIENQVSGVVSVVEQLLDQDPTTEYAYTCHKCVQHVSKLQREGGFCGYRNIQMMTSYIIGTESQGFYHFKGKIPTIFQIQEYIEHAWDLGINKQGRQETGGIRGTRKYIGTPEAQAMFVSLDIACNAEGFRSKGNLSAVQLLLQYVERYYSAGCTNSQAKIRNTELAPLYFQHPGHSMTITGFEKKKDGTVNLLVFDPMFRDSRDVHKLIGQTFTHKYPTDMLRAYRRPTKYLRKYAEFEVLLLTPHDTLSTAPIA